MRSILRIAFFGSAFVFLVCEFLWSACGGYHVLVCGDMDPDRPDHFLPEWYTHRLSFRYGLRYHYFFRPIRPDVISACWPILRLQLRIGSSAPGPGDYDIVKWYHVECFPFPRKLKSEGETCQTFVETIMEDNTDEGILNDEEKAAEIIALLEQKGCRKKVDAETGESPPQGASDVIAKIKRTAELIAQEDDEDGPKSKKVKTETEISETDRTKAEIFAVLSSKKVDELKDVLRWNKQIVGGNKDTLLARIVDAKLRGRLGRCPSCLRGRVKLTEEDGGGAYCFGLLRIS